MGRGGSLAVLAFLAAIAHGAIAARGGPVGTQATQAASAPGVLRSRSRCALRALVLVAKLGARAVKLRKQCAREAPESADVSGEVTLQQGPRDAPTAAAVAHNTQAAAGCSTYCTSSTTTHGCVPVISCTGVFSASLGSPFVLTVSEVEGARSGKILYSLAAHPTMPQAPNGNTSYRCLQSPTKSTGLQFSGGTLNGCDGSLTVDFSAFMAANPGAPGNPLMAGQTFYAQGVFKDPGAPGTINYSDALSFTVVP